METTNNISIHRPSYEAPEPIRKPNFARQDRNARRFLTFIASGLILFLFSLIAMLVIQSSDAITDQSFALLESDWWNPINDEFGSLAFVYGTIVSSAVALLIAAPISIAVAILITQILPQKIAALIGLFIEMIAAVPSIVFGLWGIFFLAPWIKDSVTPALKASFGFLPIFQGPSFGIGMLTASLILAIMIVPTITSICREVFKTVPQGQKEAALALGATRLETVKLAVLKPSFSGIMGGVVLGLGRALGETMAVAMVIGNSAAINTSLFAPGATMASVIANEYAEAESDLHLSALCFIALLLFVVTIVVNLSARYIVWRTNKKRGLV